MKDNEKLKRIKDARIESIKNIGTALDYLIRARNNCSIIAQHDNQLRQTVEKIDKILDKLKDIKNDMGAYLYIDMSK